MIWTNEEIVQSFHEAKDKTKQIQILAELTCSDPETIIEILEDANVFQPKIRTCSICYKRYKTINLKGKPVCAECKAASEEIASLRRELKYLTAKIQQYGLESAKIRSKITKLEEKRRKKHDKN